MKSNTASTIDGLLLNTAKLITQAHEELQSGDLATTKLIIQLAVANLQVIADTLTDEIHP